MVGYRLTPQAERDLEEIWLYTFEQWSADQADRYYDEIIDVVERLGSGILSGRHSEIRSGYKKQPAGRHLIFFRPFEEGIEVVRILHQSMDIDRHL